MAVFRVERNSGYKQIDKGCVSQARPMYILLIT